MGTVPLGAGLTVAKVLPAAAAAATATSVQGMREPPSPGECPGQQQEPFTCTHMHLGKQGRGSGSRKTLLRQAGPGRAGIIPVLK